MSETEKLKRLAYKENRKKCIRAQAILAIIVAIALIASLFAYYSLNKTYYIDYTEDADVNYRVYLKENDFYGKDYLEGGQAYVASLIDRVVADLQYELNIDADGVEYEYSYGIVAHLLITDENTNVTVLDKSYPIKENVSVVETKDRVEINETVEIDYGEYNAFATRFFDQLKLSKNDFETTLVVTMAVSVRGAAAELETDATNEYDVSVNIPLTLDVVEINIGTSVPTGESQVLACKNAINTEVFKRIATVCAFIEAVMLIILIAFVYLTRNDDINYNIKVKRIVNAYRSFIQKINNEFDTTGYQLLLVDTFNEMLAIRDTIQSPVLMSENEDQTMTRFLIPTNTKILYVFEIKVDNYDEIYGTREDADGEEIIHLDVSEPEALEEVSADVTEDVIVEEIAEVVEEVPVEEEPAEVAEEAPAEVAEEAPAEEEPAEVAEEAPAEVVEEAPVEEEPAEVAEEAPAEEEPAEVVEEAPVEEAPVEEAPVEEAPVEVVEEAPMFIPELVEIGGEDEESEDGDGSTAIAYIDEKGNLINIRCSRSFTANLIQASPTVKGYYAELKNYILSFKAVKARMSWRLDTFKKGRVQLFKMKIRGKTILLYCALDPKEFDTAKYFHEENTSKMFSGVPMMVRIKSDRGLKRAKELIALVMARFEIGENPKATEVDYASQHPYETTRALVGRGLVKLFFPEDISLYSAEHDDPHKTDEEAPVLEAAEEIALVEEAPAEAVEEVPVEEVPIEEAPAEEVPIEEAPAEVEMPEVLLVDEAEVDKEALVEAMSEPTVELDEIDYVETGDEICEEEPPAEEGVEVIGVVWPERRNKNKIYRYDPNGEVLDAGDIVLVPTRDVARGKDVIRKAAVAHGNHRVPEESLARPLKKIIGIVKRKLEDALTPDIDGKKNNKK